MIMTREGVNPPTRKTKGSCGYDISCPTDLELCDNSWTQVDLGIRMEPGDIPEGYCALITPRSSMGMKHGLKLANTVGVIDSDYTMATIKAALKTDNGYSHGNPLRLKRNDRILQMIIVPFATIPNETVPTEKRKGGLGSTGE